MIFNKRSEKCYKGDAKKVILQVKAELNIHNDKCVKGELRKVILEVQHELHIAENKEEIEYRKKQLKNLLDAAKRYYGLKRKSNSLMVTDTR